MLILVHKELIFKSQIETGSPITTISDGDPKASVGIYVILEGSFMSKDPTFDTRDYSFLTVLP